VPEQDEGSDREDGRENPQFGVVKQTGPAKVFQGRVQWGVSALKPAVPGPDMSPTKNHTATAVGRSIFIFGGYDGLKNHSDLFIFHVDTLKWHQPVVSGDAPSGRNGHTATLLPQRDRILILGGWLGNGPLAASDAHMLDTKALMWCAPCITGEPPGPCNMHTADVVQDKLLVFRGGDGRAYLNDLHALDLVQNHWHSVETTGEPPPERANHCSVVDGNKPLLYIFGGWDGSKRLNDLYLLNASTLVWTLLHPTGVPPQPRAGTTLTCIRGLLFMFGGSGHSTRCFNDIHVFDPGKSTWFTAVPCDKNGTPEKRAGHAAVACDRKVLIFGGACGTQYYGRGQIYSIDTDAPPILAPSEGEPLPPTVPPRDVLAELFESAQFSDVTFSVQGRELPAHRVLLAVFSDHFRAMLGSGMRESTATTIPIEGVSYEAFRSLLRFLYVGELGYVQKDTVSSVELLHAADQFCVEPLKRVCAEQLAKAVDASNAEEIKQHAELAHAPQLVTYCEWVLRQERYAAPPSV